MSVRSGHPLGDILIPIVSVSIIASAARPLDYRRNPLLQAFLPAMEAAHRTIVQSPLEDRTQELVRIRVSQINGCSFCVGLHTQDAITAGEDPQRLHLQIYWRIYGCRGR